MAVGRPQHSARASRCLLLWLVLCPAAGRAQGQIGLVAPGYGVAGGFAEGIGVHAGAQQWGPQGGWFFHSGGPLVGPPFGGFDPGGQASFQLGGQSGHFRWGLGITASQGSSQSLVSQSPSIMLPNGGAGFFSNATQTPFVTGFVPVLGAGYVSPVRERWRRLQYERALATNPERNDQRGQGDRASELPDPEASAPSADRRRDDPPLILRKDGGPSPAARRSLRSDP